MFVSQRSRPAIISTISPSPDEPGIREIELRSYRRHDYTAIGENAYAAATYGHSNNEILHDHDIVLNEIREIQHDHGIVLNEIGAKVGLSWWRLPFARSATSVSPQEQPSTKKDIAELSAKLKAVAADISELRAALDKR